MAAKKAKPKSGSKGNRQTKKVDPAETTLDHKRQFDQLLDDAIFGVKKKNPRG